jgi:hypothetical protein
MSKVRDRFQFIEQESKDGNRVAVDHVLWLLEQQKALAMAFYLEQTACALLESEIEELQSIIDDLNNQVNTLLGVRDNLKQQCHQYASLYGTFHTSPPEVVG